MKIKLKECSSGGYIAFLRLDEKHLALTQGNNVIDTLENLINAIKTLNEYDENNRNKILS